MRLLDINTRIYANGYDLSGVTHGVGERGASFQTELYACRGDAINGAAVGQAEIVAPTINTVLQTGSGGTGAHDVFKSVSVVNLMVLNCETSTPALGDVAYVGRINAHYTGTPGDVLVSATLTPDGVPVDTALLYGNPWGVCLKPKGSVSAVNSSTGADGLASSSLGGYIMYQIFSVTGTGTVTIKLQDAAVNSNASFADVTGATSGAIANTAAPTSGIVQLATSATVRQYTRWQIVFSGATACDFALAFVRGTGV